MLLYRAAQRILLLVIGILLAASTASAHPHVWVISKSEIVYDPNGTMTGVRHAWTFDEMFSSFATQGLDVKEKGKFTREELAPLAEVNVTSLKEFKFFTFARLNGRKSAFNDPTDYWLEFRDGALTLFFTLPLKTPAAAKSVDIDIYDPSMFVDFALAEKDPVQLVGAPASCKLTVARPNDTLAGKQLGEDFFDALASNADYGARFANKIAVKCP
jgi:ABC-type uncharacterized transport system substrate-binding protein